MKTNFGKVVITKKVSLSRICKKPSKPELVNLDWTASLSLEKENLGRTAILGVKGTVQRDF